MISFLTISTGECWGVQNFQLWLVSRSSMTNWKISQKKGFLKIWSLVEVSQIDPSMIISMPNCLYCPFSSGFSVRADELTNQTDNESTLLNLQFLQMELQTFMDGYKFKGFYFPIRSVVSTFIKYLNSNVKVLQLPRRSSSWFPKVVWMGISRRSIWLPRYYNTI